MEKTLKWLKTNLDEERAFPPVNLPRLLTLELAVFTFYNCNWLGLTVNLLEVDVLTPWRTVNYNLKGSLLKLDLKVQNYFRGTGIEIDLLYGLFYYSCQEDEDGDTDGRYLTDLKLAWQHVVRSQ